MAYDCCGLEWIVYIAVARLLPLALDAFGQSTSLANLEKSTFGGPEWPYDASFEIHVAEVNCKSHFWDSEKVLWSREIIAHSLCSVVSKYISWWGGSSGHLLFRSCDAH